MADSGEQTDRLGADGTREVRVPTMSIRAVDRIRDDAVARPTAV